MSCPQTGCGLRRTTRGRAKSGWINVREAADSTGVWYCSYECVAKSFGVDEIVIPDVLKPHEALQHLNRLARRCVTPYDVTPEKIRRMLDLAFKRLVDHYEADVACLEETG